MVSPKVEGLSASDLAAQQHAKLVDAAQQFEAIFLGELLKPMQSKEGSWGGEETGGDGSNETLATYGAESVAKAISKAGGMGIARQVIQKVELEHSAAK